MFSLSRLNSSNVLIFVLGLLSLSAVLLYNNSYITSQLDAYALNKAQQQFGSQPLAPEQEAFIRSIATKMGAPEHIVIRRMNPQALVTLGYYNAVTYFTLLFNLIPISPTPFLFVSEGFLEDLSLDEQQFLIGHEMVHIREQHTRYLNLIWLLSCLLLLGCAWIMRKWFKKVIIRLAPDEYQKALTILITCLLIAIAEIAPDLGALAYRRHIEQIADNESLTTLSSYDGCLKLIDRWQCEFKMAAHNPYLGLLSDHPSCSERRAYCIQLSNNHNERVVT